jgi:hypothetical protein
VAGLSALPCPAGRADDPDPEPPSAWPRTRPADRRISANNLKQIALGFHNFHDTYGRMPAAAVTDAKGKALLSWRVALLPFLEEGRLYREFKLDEAWDSNHNKKLLAKIPKVYAPPVAGKPAKPNATYYQVFTGSDTPFNPRWSTRTGTVTLGPRIANFTDGTSNTILVAEAGAPVPWTKPDDLAYDAKKAVPKLGGLFPEGFHVAMADGAVRYLGRKVPEKALRALVTPSGGEVIDWSTIPAAKAPAGKE